mmetsp:Transcript_3652/g.10623  ORF Transcript_3652/g.10623 Transcript_3652/m.10623 type:complete len:202 (+) Transcript_3652:270-875(+)
MAGLSGQQRCTPVLWRSLSATGRGSAHRHVTLLGLQLLLLVLVHLHALPRDLLDLLPHLLLPPAGPLPLPPHGQGDLLLVAPGVLPRRFLQLVVLEVHPPEIVEAGVDVLREAPRVRERGAHGGQKREVDLAVAREPHVPAGRAAARVHVGALPGRVVLEVDLACLVYSLVPVVRQEARVLPRRPARPRVDEIDPPTRHGA